VVQGPDIAEGEGVLNAASIDLHYSISCDQSDARNGAATLDTFNQLAMLSLTVLVIEAQSHWKLPAGVVHQKGAVKNGGSGKERCQCGQQLFRERFPAHDLAGQRQGVCTGEGPDEA
jgi:hypothetical protein